MAETSMTEAEVITMISGLQDELEGLQRMLAELRGVPSVAQGALSDEERERRHQEDLQRIRGFRLMDDVFMNACFDGFTEGAELLLRVILDMPDVRVSSVRTQRLLKNLAGRDVQLDLDAVDGEGRRHNVEVQRSDAGASVERARYHSSMLDASLLRPSEDFRALPETYVVFITEGDVLGGGLPRHAVDRVVKETGLPFGDREHIVYVNGEDTDPSTELGRLMHDFSCTDPGDMHSELLAGRVRHYKEDEEGIATMCKVLEDVRVEAERRTVAVVIQKIMTNLKMTSDEAMDVLEVPKDQRAAYAALVGQSRR